MAKVVSPFYGLGASGTLGKAIVFSGWKGVKYVRQWVVPANPNTGSQQTIRGFFKAAVTAWHAGLLTVPDHTSLMRWATYTRAGLSGFNKYVSEYVKVRVTPLSWSAPRNLVASSITSTSALLSICQLANDATMTATFYVGTNQGYMPNQGPGAWNAGTSRYELSLTWFTALTYYYVRVVMTKAGYSGVLGNYMFKTT